MKKIIRLSFLISLVYMGIHGRLSAQEPSSLPLSFHGYTQLRFSTNFSNVHSFSLRRLKLWIVPKTNFSKHWDFKIQTTLTSLKNEAFFLQDVMLRYKKGSFSVKMGQFTPEYSLERFEHDYSLPVAERSIVIDRLIPNATLGVRDIGFEGAYKSPSGIFETWMGIFNGYGIKEYRFDNTGIMLTHKTTFHLLKKHWITGYSIMYRRGDQLAIPKVLPDGARFTGDDFRFNLFSKIHWSTLSFQTEYFYANINHRYADGYYFMGVWTKNKQSIAASYNQYTDLIDDTPDDPEIHLTYSYLFKGDRIKLMLDNGVKLGDHSIYDYFLLVQFQFFIN
jgi:hypothetical protein